MSFAENLKHAMEEVGLTPLLLSETLRLSSDRIDSWLSGETYPRMDEMKILSRALKQDAEGLIPDGEIDQYINFSLTNGSSSSSGFGDVLLVGAVMVGLLPGFFTGVFQIGIAGAVFGAVIGFLLRRLYIKKN